MSKDDIFRYPEEIKSQFFEKDDLVFKDGTRATTEQIWNFMADEGPRRYPYAFNTSTHHVGRISSDVNFLSGIKRGYFALTLYDRMTKAQNSGVPIVFIQGGQGMEPYYAAGGIPARPAFISQWALNKKEGLNLREADIRGNKIREESRKAISVEACQTAGYGTVQEGFINVDLIAPYLCLRCSDIAYGVEAYRHGKVKVPLFLVDYPVGSQQDAEWAVKYLSKNLFDLVQEISKLSGKEVTEDDVKNEIKLHNQIRRLARKYADLWWGAKVPPTNSVDHSSTLQLGNEGYGDPTAAKQILEESYVEAKERVKNSVKGEGLSDDPARLFICGSCVTPNPYLVDKAGGVVVAKDDGWSEVSTDVAETGNPYENLARAILSYPYEQPTEERAAWTAEQVKKSNADGLIFMYNWGCNYQTAIAREVADIVKTETGIPTINIELAELGRREALEQSHNRVEAFIEMLR